MNTIRFIRGGRPPSPYHCSQEGAEGEAFASQGGDEEEEEGALRKRVG